MWSRLVQHRTDRRLSRMSQGMRTDAVRRSPLSIAGRVLRIVHHFPAADCVHCTHSFIGLKPSLADRYLSISPPMRLRDCAHWVKHFSCPDCAPDDALPARAA
ncbi:hypothetical protein XHV734_0644 [Xanthomonas hortorum pv. vitians]|nr:hypothetical protein XHV734_0644 [Xanthomonas hortorum pv. vitians]